MDDGTYLHLRPLFRYLSLLLDPSLFDQMVAVRYPDGFHERDPLQSGGWDPSINDLLRLSLGHLFFKEIRRIFEYHGAEHKSIFAFESGDKLMADRVKGYSHLHPRCGTSFLLVVMVVSIVVFALIPHQLSFGYKVASRVVFIPLIAGLAYEIIRFADQKREKKSMQYFIKPGLWLQRMTAREPSEDQIEVALRALQEVLELEGRRN